MDWIHKGVHVHDKLIYEDAHRLSSSVLNNDTSAIKNVTKDESQVLENNDKQR